MTSLLLAAVSAPAFAATPEEDAQAVLADYRGDKDVTPCRFSRAQLVNALRVAEQNNIDSYEPGFRDEVRREIARDDAGGCGGVAGENAAARLRIVRVRPRRRLKESVTVKNLGTRTVKLRGIALRDRSGARVRLGSGRLAAGKSLRVFSGCAKGRKRFVRVRSRAFACRKRTLWNNGGDVVRLVGADGTLLSRAGYGRFRSVKRF